MNIPQTNLPRVVIIGAGFAGVNLAKKLDATKMQVVLINQTNYHTFQPLLYQVATAGLEPDSIVHSIRTMFKKEKHFFFRIAEISNINPQENIIESNLGTLSYDYLVIATGSTTNYYGNSNIEKYAIPMKNILEAINIRSLVIQNLEKALLTNDLDERNRLMNFVIVGGGPTGVELAGAFAELKNHILPTDYPDLDMRRMNVHLIQADNRLLTGMSDYAGKKAKEYLEKMDVHLWFNTIVKDYDGRIAITSNENFDTTSLIWTAGVRGNVIEGFPKESVIASRYAVDEYNRIKGFENVFAIGDVACMMTEKYPKGHPMVAQVAIQQGITLAKNVKRKIKGQEPLKFQYNDKGSMATIGRDKAVADIRGIHISGWLAWIAWMFVHLVSLVGFRNKIVALVNWVIQYFQYNKGVRLIIRPYRPPHQMKNEEIRNIYHK